eukprot:1210013-Prymnesium_polylepis.1
MAQLRALQARHATRLVCTKGGASARHVGRAIAFCGDRHLPPDVRRRDSAEREQQQKCISRACLAT